MVCEACKVTFPLASLSCPFCQTVTGGKTCERCRKSKALSGIVALFDYEHDGVKRLIVDMKYKGLFSILRAIQPEIKELIDANEHIFIKGALLIPAPIRKNSFSARGFNQAKKILQIISDVSGLPTADILQFAPQVKTQHNQSKTSRWQNVDNRITMKRLAKHIQHAIVVDDLITTGATLESCAQALKQAGVKDVWGMTLARQKKFFT